MSRRMKRPMTDHTKTAARLRSHPRMWMPVGEYNSTQSAEGMAHMIRTGQAKQGTSPYAPAGTFETRVELTEFGAELLAQYVGSAGGAS